MEIETLYRANTKEEIVMEAHRLASKYQGATKQKNTTPADILCMKARECGGLGHHDSQCPKFSDTSHATGYER